jgi:hypothetical protein
MNVTTLVFLGLAVVWAIVLLPELARKVAGSRHSDTIRSFNQQLSVLDRGGRGAARSNVIDLRARTSRGTSPSAASPARPVPMSVRKRRQEVLTALGAAAVLTLVCTVAFGGTFFLLLHLLADVLLVTYLVLLAQVNQARAAAPSAPRRRAAAPERSALRTATVGRPAPASRRIAN